jgi:hypothetical protein
MLLFSHASGMTFFVLMYVYVTVFRKRQRVFSVNEKRETWQYDGDSTIVTIRQYDGKARHQNGDSPSNCRIVTIVLPYCHHRSVVMSPQMYIFIIKLFIPVDKFWF